MRTDSLDSVYAAHLEATLVECTSAVRQPLASLERRSDGRVGLPLLERLERVEVWIGVVKGNDVPVGQGSGPMNGMG